MSSLPSGPGEPRFLKYGFVAPALVFLSGFFRAGIGFRGGPTATITDNCFEDNQTLALYTGTYISSNNISIEAEGNWWGSTDPQVLKSVIRDRAESGNGPYVTFKTIRDGCNGTLLTGAPTYVQGWVNASSNWDLAGSPYEVTGALSTTGH